MTDTPEMGARPVFICYARADGSMAASLIADLKRENVGAWRDIEGIHGAALWRKEIVGAIRECSMVLFLASNRSCASEHVAKELAIAEEEGKRILPIFLEPVELPDEIRFQVAGIQRIEWNVGRNPAFQDILAAVRYYGQNVPSPTPVPAPAAAPHALFRTRMRATLSAAIVFFVLLLVISAPYLVSRLRATAPHQAAPATTASGTSSVASVPAVPIARHTWYVETATKASDYRRYLGLRIRYRLFLNQGGNELTAQGEKIGEVRGDEAIEFSGRGKTPITLSGHITASAQGPPTISLLGTEGSLSRDSFSTSFRLNMISDDLLIGTFTSTAANASGDAIWISEEKWRAAGWAARQ